MRRRKFDTSLELLIIFYLIITLIPILTMFDVLDHTHTNILVELHLFGLPTINFFTFLVGSFGLILSVTSISSPSFRASELFIPTMILQIIVLSIGIIIFIFGDLFDQLFFLPLFIVALSIHVYKLKHYDDPTSKKKRKKSHQ